MFNLGSFSLFILKKKEKNAYPDNQMVRVLRACKTNSFWLIDIQKDKYTYKL